MRLFCFPFAGGGAAVFHSWGRILPEWIECRAVKLPGREDRFREKAYTRVGPFIEALAPEILPLLDRPFAFYGHSMGTLLAFELALELRRRQAGTPAALFLGGGPAPESRPPRTSLQTDAELMKEVRSYEGDFGVALEDADFREFILPLLRADFALYDSYSAPEEASLDCPFFIFGGDGDPRVTSEQLAGWRIRTRGPFHLEFVPGGHFFLKSSVDALLERIGSALYGLCFF